MQNLKKTDVRRTSIDMYLAKARKNYTIGNLIFRISEQDDLKKSLSMPQDFNMHEWVIIVSYYAMYTSALAAISRLGFKSKSHAATIAILENYYVKNEKLETKHIDKLTKAYTLSEDMITMLMEMKERRETAQYEATPAITRENAKTALEDAEEFVSKIEDVLGS